MSAEIAGVFTELFFGAGSWLGVLLLLAIIVGLAMTAQWVAVLMLPVTVFLGIDYLTEELLWNAVIMFFSCIFILVQVMRRGD